MHKLTRRSVVVYKGQRLLSFYHFFSGLIEVSLLGSQDTDIESRYMLILTEAFAALGILQQHMENMGEAITIFGSSFPRDQEYTQVGVILVLPVLGSLCNCLSLLV